MRHLDVERFIDYQAIMALISNEDWYSKNWLLAQERVAPGEPHYDEKLPFRWTVLPWDLDLSFGQLSLNDEAMVTEKHPLAGTVDHPRVGSSGRRWSGLAEAVFGRRER